VANVQANNVNRLTALHQLHGSVCLAKTAAKQSEGESERAKERARRVRAERSAFFVFCVCI